MPVMVNFCATTPWKMNASMKLLPLMKCRLSVSLAVFLLVLGVSAPAQMLYWDGNTTTSNGTLVGGNGTWDNSTTNWNPSSTGSSTNQAWVAGDTAVFGIQTGGTGTYTVTLSDASGLTAGGLVFNAGGYTLAGGTSPGVAPNLFLTGNSTVSVAQGLATLAVSIYNNASTLTGVTKSGAGTLLLSADNSGMFVGGTPALTLNAGTLQASTSANALGGASVALQLGGGILQLTSASGLSFSNNTTIAGNVLVLSDRGAVGAGVTNTFGTLSLSGTLLNINNGQTSSGASGLTFGATTLTGGSTILSATYGSGTNLITMASLDGSGANAGLVVGGSGNVTVTGTTGLGSGNLTKFNNGTLTFGGAVTTTGTVSLNQETSGNVILGGTNAAFVSTQAITVNGGIFTLGSTSNASSSGVDRISNTATLTLAGGNLAVTQLTAANTEQIGTLTLGPGASSIYGQNPTSGGSGNAIVSFGALGTIAPGALLDFKSVGGSTGSVQFFTAAPTLVNGIIGGWASQGDSFATVSGINVSVSAAASTAVSADFSGTVDTTRNLKLTITTNTTVTLANSSTINSLILNTPSSGFGTLNLGGNTLTLNTGGLLGVGSTPYYYLMNGTLTAGTTSAASQLYYTANTNQKVMLGATVADNGLGGSLSVVLGGNAGNGGYFFLSGANTYTGNTYVDGATAYILSDRQLGATPSGSGSPVVFLSNAATLSLNPRFSNGSSRGYLPVSLATNRVITLGGGGSNTSNGNGIVMGGGDSVFANTITGVGALGIMSNANSFVTLSGASTYDGPTFLPETNGYYAFTTIGNIGGGASALGAPTTAANGRINMSGMNTKLTYVGTGSATTDRPIEMTAAGECVIAAGAGAITLNGNILQSSVSGIQLGGYGVGILNGNILQLNATATTLQNGAGSSLAVGLWRLYGQNTYAGTTLVQNGVIDFNTINNVGAGASSLGAPTTAANGTITLQSGGILRFMGDSSQSSDRAITLGISTNNIGKLEASGTAPITFSGGVTLATATSAFTLGGFGNGFLSGAGIISGNGTLTMQGFLGLGNWTLNQSASNTYIGTTTVNAGTLTLDFSNLATPTNLISGNSAVTLGGGTLSILGKPGAATSQTFASLSTTTATSSTLSVNANGGTSANLTVTTWNTITNQSTLDVKTTGTVTIFSNPALTNGIVARTTFNETDFATVSGGAVVAYSAYSSFNGTSGGSQTLNYLLAGGSTLTTDTLANGLKIAPTGAGQVLNLGNHTLSNYNYSVSNILFDGSSYDYTIQNGNVGINWADSYINTAGSHVLTVSATLANAGASFIKAGAGTLILSGNNSYAGNTYVEAGTLQAGSNTGFSPYSPVKINPGGVLSTGAYNSGVFYLSGTGVVQNGSGSAQTLTIGANNAIAYTGSAGTDVNPFYGSSTFSGMIRDGASGSLSLVKAGYGTQYILNNWDQMNTYTGSTSVLSGVLSVAAVADSGAVSSIGQGSTINLGSTGQVGILQLHTIQTINNETNRTINLAAGGGGGFDVQNNGGMLPGGCNNGWYSPNGGMFGALLTLNGTITGAGTLEKLGTGNLVLSGVSSYTGGTVVEQGVLLFANSSAVPASGAISVIDGGTVGTGYAIDQAFLSKVTSTSTGVVALGADSSNNLAFTGLANAALGATGHFIFSGSLTPGGGTYQLGGGGQNMACGENSANGPLSALTIANANTITGANNVVVSAHGTAGAAVVFADKQNYSGTTTVSGGLNTAYLSILFSPAIQGEGNIGSGSNTASWAALSELDLVGSITTTSAINLNPLGTLKLMASANLVNFLPDAAPINFNGGNLAFMNDGSAANFSETTGAMNLNRGGSEVMSLPATAGYTSVLTFSSLTRSPGATVLFAGNANLGVSSINQIGFTAATGLSATLATPWAFTSNSSATNLGMYLYDRATDFAVMSGTGAGSFVMSRNGTVIAADTSLAGDDYTLNTSIALAANRSANTIRETTAATTITTGSYTLAVNGLLNAYSSASTTPFTIGAAGGDLGTLTAVGSSGGEIIINAAGGYNSFSAYGAISVNTNIKDNGGAVSVVKTGNGDLTLNGNNTFSGGLVIDGPSRVVGNGTNSLGTGTITMNSGAITTNGLTANATIANNWVINGDAVYQANSAVAGVTMNGTITLNNSATFWLLAGSNQTMSFNGAIGGTGGNLGIQGLGSNAMILGGTAANTYTGKTYLTGSAQGAISNSSLTYTNVYSLEKLNTGGNVNAISGNILLGQNTVTNIDGGGITSPQQQEILVLNNSGLTGSTLSTDQIADTSVITFQGGNGFDAGVFRLNNRSETIAGIQSSIVGDGLIQNNSSTNGTSTLTLATVSGQNTIFSGILQNQDNRNPGNLGVLALTVTGSGIQQLTNVNTYTGGTTVSGGTLSFANGSLGISGNITVNGGTLQWNGSNTQDISSRLVLQNAGSAILDTNGNNVTLASVIGSTSSLTKVGAGTLTLSGNNTYTGGTTVSGGTLSFANGALGSSGNITVNGGTLQWNGSNTQDISSRLALQNSGSAFLDTNGNSVTLASAIGSSSSLTKVGVGTLTLSAANTYTGTTTISAGKLALGNALALQNSAYNTTGSTGAIGLDVTGYTTPTLGGLVGSVDLATAITGYGSVTELTLNPQTGSSNTYGGVIANGSAGMTLTKTGGGTQTLSGNNTYTGATMVGNGTLSFNSVAAGAAAQALGGGNTVNLGVAGTSSGNLSYTGGNGTLDKNIFALGNGTDTIQNNGTGLLTITGTLTKNGTILTLKGGTNGITISGNGTIAGSNSGSDLIVDGGITTLATANTYNGPTSIINGATLNANATNALPTAAARTAVSIDPSGTGNSTLALGASQSIAFLTGNSTSKVTLGANTLTLGTSGNSSTTFAGVISGTGGNVTKDDTSTQVFSGNNTYTGTTTVSVGTLLINGDQSTATGPVSVAATLGGSGKIGGAVTIQDGGFLAPGNNTTGILTVASLALNSTSTTHFEINGTAAPGTNYDQIVVKSGGALALNGAFTIAFGNVADLANTTNINLFSYTTGHTGDFTSLVSTGYYGAAGTAWTHAGETFSYNTGTQLLTFDELTGNLDISAVPEPATCALLAFSLTAVVVLRRRRRD